MSMQKKQMSTAQKIKKMVVIALFCALAYVAMFIFRINVAFLTFDIKDAIIAICGLIFGPVAALVSSFTVAMLELITVSDTGFYGFIMNFLSTASFSCAAALVYKYRRDIIGAVIGLVSAVCSMTAVMICANIIITPFFMKASREEVINMIPTLFLPFNVTKAVFNAALVLFLYKPVSSALKAANVIKLSEHNNKERSVLQTVLTTAVGILLVFAAALVFILVLKGKVSWF